MHRREFIYGLGAGMAAMAVPGAFWAGVPGESEEARDRRMQWWREARFGLFIHWGIYSIPAGVWKGKQAKLMPSEWIMNAFEIPDAEYSQLAAQFNPVQFDATEWVRIAKAAGMKYLVITSKHHDGFCMFDSKLTDYDIVDATPFKRDVIRELSQACAEEGIRFGLYYSQLDWHHAVKPGILGRIPDFPAYLEYMKGQLQELLTNYGPINSMFFDGDWMAQWTQERGREVEAWVRSFQPEVVINNRLDKRPLLNHLVFYLGRAPELKRPEVGDYATPEQAIPQGVPKCDWETCMTMNDSWGYKSFDQNWKSSTTLIRDLVDIAGKGGNFLLNVGPTSEGLIPEPSVERLAEIGKWIQVNGESIYGTSAGPFPNLPWGRSTQKPGKIFVQVFDWPQGDLVIPGMSQKIVKAFLLADPKQSPLEFKTTGTDLLVKLPAQAPDPAASVLVLAVG